MYHTVYCAAGWLIQSNCQAQYLITFKLKYVPSCHSITDITSLSIFVRLFVIADRCYFEKAIYIHTETSVFHQFDQAKTRTTIHVESINVFSWFFICFSASIFLNKHRVDMVNEFLFSLGNFGKKKCLPYPIRYEVFDLFGPLTKFSNFAHRGCIKSSNFDPIFGRTNRIQCSATAPPPYVYHFPNFSFFYVAAVTSRALTNPQFLPVPAVTGRKKAC